MGGVINPLSSLTVSGITRAFSTSGTASTSSATSTTSSSERLRDFSLPTTLSEVRLADAALSVDNASASTAATRSAEYATNPVYDPEAEFQIHISPEAFKVITGVDDTTTTVATQILSTQELDTSLYAEVSRTLTTVTDEATGTATETLSYTTHATTLTADAETATATISGTAPASVTEEDYTTGVVAYTLPDGTLTQVKGRPGLTSIEFTDDNAYDVPDMNITPDLRLTSANPDTSDPEYYKAKTDLKALQALDTLQSLLEKSARETGQKQRTEKTDETGTVEKTAERATPTAENGKTHVLTPQKEVKTAGLHDERTMPVRTPFEPRAQVIVARPAEKAIQTASGAKAENRPKPKVDTVI